MNNLDTELVIASWYRHHARRLSSKGLSYMVDAVIEETKPLSHSEAILLEASERLDNERDVMRDELRRGIL